MPGPRLSVRGTAIVGSIAVLLTVALPPGQATHAADEQNGNLAPPIEKGQRVFSAGHSFHYFMPKILEQLVQEAGIKDHVQIGMSNIGGSKIFQHWDVADDKNEMKKVLGAGQVDVLTLAPRYLPDDGIEKVADLAVEHNPAIRINVDEFWLPFDVYDPKVAEPDKVDHDALTVDELRKMHAMYFKDFDDHLEKLNEKYGKQVLFVVPVGQAVVALREKIIAGQAPGLAKQSDLFTDAIGHATPPLEALASYCQFAVMYRRSPVGLKLASVPNESLNRLLQELAWQAVIEHPLSGVRTESKP
jgi:hypothetical protein